MDSTHRESQAWELVVYYHSQYCSFPSEVGTVVNTRRHKDFGTSWVKGTCTNQADRVDVVGGRETVCLHMKDEARMVEVGEEA